VYFRNHFQDRPEIVIAQVDCIKNNEICDREQVRKFPSLVLYLQGQVVKEYPDWQPRKKFHFKKFIDEFINPQSAYKGIDAVYIIRSQKRIFPQKSV